MARQKLQDIWKEQCVAARNVRAQHGILSSLDYLIGEKLVTYAETAVTRPEFARELPRFVAEVRDIFSREEIRHYLDHLERMATIQEDQAANDHDGELFGDSPDQRIAKRARLAQAKGATHVRRVGDGIDEGARLQLQATYVSIDEFDDRYFQVSFDTEEPGAEFDLSAPMKPYLLIQCQFEDDGGGVCYVETHDPDRYAGHFPLRLIEFSPTRLIFDIDRARDRRVEVTFTLDPHCFREIKRIVSIIFGVNC